MVFPDSPVAPRVRILPLSAVSAQELGECLQTLGHERYAAAMTLSECWFREHQVLPLRTHPFMNHSGAGGFLLSGQVVWRGDRGDGGGEGARAPKRPKAVSE